MQNDSEGLGTECFPGLLQELQLIKSAAAQADLLLCKATQTAFL